MSSIKKMRLAERLSAQSVRIPITNVYAKGGYCARIHIGAHQHPVNLILDTGSSTLAVHNGSYRPENDKSLQATVYEQDVCYGLGGWYGPVVKTSVAFGLLGNTKLLKGVNVAVTAKEESTSFANADGILGLAYRGLNKAYDLSDFLTKNSVTPQFTYPYTMSQTDASVQEYRQFLHSYPQVQLTPYFTQLEEEGVVANQFALLTHRSSIYQSDSECPIKRQSVAHHNHGLFVLGKPKLHADLYQGDFVSVAVLDDKYYNVNVCGVQVGNTEILKAPPLKDKEVKGYRTNGIVDSGASMIMFPGALHAKVIEELKKHNDDFAALLKPFETFTGEELGVALCDLNLADWPAIHIYMQGVASPDKEEKLTIQPDTYWQVHAPKPNQASFKLLTTPNWPSQSILGLPLLNNYYTVFDREAGDKGEIHFAHKAALIDHMREAINTVFHPSIDNNTKD